MDDPAIYPPLSPYDTGLKGRCPRCGEGRLFAGFITPAQRCNVCGLDYSFADSGDGPAVFIILIIGFMVVAGALSVELSFQPPYWVHAILWLPLGILLPLLVLRPAKGLMIALQYHHKAREGHVED